MAPDTEEDPFQNFAALISELVGEVEGSVVVEWACTRRFPYRPHRYRSNPPASPGPSLYHLGAKRSIGVIGAGQRTLAVICGRCRPVRLLHFAAAPLAVDA